MVEHVATFADSHSAAQNISGVVLPQDMDELEDLRHDSLTHSVIGQCIVSLGKSGVRDGGACDDRLVVTEHVRLSFDGYTEVTKGSPQVDDLFGGDTCSDKLGSIGAVSTVSWRLENQSTGVPLTMCRIPVTTLPTIMS